MWRTRWPARAADYGEVPHPPVLIVFNHIGTFCSPHADGVDRATRSVQFPAGTEFVEDDAVEAGPDPGPAPPGEASVDRLPARTEHRRQLSPGAARGRCEDDRGQCFAVTRSTLGHHTAEVWTSVGGTTRRNDTHNSSGTSRSTRSVMHGSTRLETVSYGW